MGDKVSHSIKRDIIAKKIVLAVISIPILGAVIYSLTGHSLSPFANEYDTLQQKAVSPDGEYTAKLLYRENLAMTYGYDRITIDSRNDPSNDEVVEVADEGLEKVAWNDRRTLVVTYDASSKLKDDNAVFVKKRSSWRDIRIVYHPTIVQKKLK